MKKLSRFINFAFIGLIALTIPLLYQNCAQVDEKTSKSLSSGGTEESNSPEISVEIHNGAGVLIAASESLCGPDESIEENTGDTESTEDNSNNELNKVQANQSEAMDESNENVSSENTRMVRISVTVPSSANAYFCRRTLPLADEDFWNCEEAMSLDDMSTGSFSEGDEENMDSDDTTTSTTSDMDAAEDSTTSTTSDATTTTTMEASTKQVILSYVDLSDETYEIEIYADGTAEDGTAWTSSVVPVSFVVEDCQSSEEVEETTSTTVEETTTTTVGE